MGHWRRKIFVAKDPTIYFPTLLHFIHSFLYYSSHEPKASQRRTHLQRHSRRSHSSNPFAMISTISTIPIGDDLNNPIPIGDDLAHSDSHWRRSSTILIPIRDTDSHSRRLSTIPIRTLHDNSWRFEPFTRISKSSPPIRTIRDDPEVVTAIQRPSASHRSPIRLIRQCLPLLLPLF